MYSHTIEPFGNFEKHTIANASGDVFMVVPAFGANLLDLQFGGISVIEGYQNAEELAQNAWSKNIILFPFPNRIKDGIYTHEGKTYQFPINNVDTGNAIHGFSSNVKMTVAAVETTENEGILTCTYTHGGSHKGYPFRFSFKITFILRGPNLDVDMSITNEDTATIPAGLGWHPYFRLSEKSDDTFLQMPDCQLVMIDERMIPTGEKTNFTDFNTATQIKDSFLDNGFYIKNQTQNAEVILSSNVGRLTCWQETGMGKWNFVQVFTPPHRMSIAVEPMTCNVDAFNNKDGLAILKPHETLQGRFGVRFEKAEKS
jgi:aldose 1-epimerase